MGIVITPILSFGEIEKIAASGDLYVMNNSDQNNARSRGNLVFDVKDENQESIGVVIPDTWLPINMATHADSKLFPKSAIFRKMVTQRNLVVIATSEAEKILSSPEARQEQKRVREYQTGNQQAINNMGIGRGDAPADKMTISTGGNVHREHVSVEEKVDNVDDNAVLRLVSDFNNGQVTSEQAIDALQTMTPTVDAVKVASGNVANTSSPFFNKLMEIISGGPIPDEDDMGNE